MLDLTLGWNVLEKHVSVAPRNVQLSPTQATYESGDSIQCSAEGIPEASYQWTDMHSGTAIRGAVLVISDDMANKSHAFKCIASNYFNGTVHKNSTTIVFSVIIGNFLPRYHIWLVSCVWYFTHVQPEFWQCCCSIICCFYGRPVE